VRVGIQGDRIGAWTSFYKIPENWRRAREQRTWYNLTVLGARIILSILLLAAGVFALASGIRHGLVRWALATKIAALCMGFELVNVLNSLPQVMARYDTQISPQVFGVVTVVGVAVALVGSGLAAFLATALAMACFPDAPSVLRFPNLARWRRDALAAVVVSLGAQLIINAVSAWIQYAGSRFALAPSLSVPSDLGTYLPLLSGINDVFTGALFLSIGSAFVIYLWKQFARRLWIRSGFVVVLLVSVLPDGAKRFSEVALDLVPTLLVLGAAVAIVAVFFRDNYAAYLVVPAIIVTRVIALSWLSQMNTALTVQGFVLLILVLGAALAILLRHAPAAECPQ
jgi:hypothetical protein